MPLTKARRPYRQSDRDVPAKCVSSNNIMRKISMFPLSRSRRIRCLIFGALALSFTVGAAEYPDKQLTFVVPFAAGSATDQLARALGQEVTRITKQPVVVDDKPGASGFIG